MKCIKCGTKLTNKNWKEGKKTRHFLCDSCYTIMYERSK